MQHIAIETPKCVVCCPWNSVKSYGSGRWHSRIKHLPWKSVDLCSIQNSRWKERTDFQNCPLDLYTCVTAHACLYIHVYTVIITTMLKATEWSGQEIRLNKEFSLDTLKQGLFWKTPVNGRKDADGHFQSTVFLLFSWLRAWLWSQGCKLTILLLLFPLMLEFHTTSQRATLSRLGHREEGT